MRHTLYIGAVFGAWGLLMALLPVGALLVDLRPAHGQAGPPNEVINQGRKALAITPSDSVDLTLGPTRGLWNGGTAGCAIAVILADDTAAVTLLGAPSGPLPLRAKRVMATNTTCTGIIGLW